MSQQKKAYSDLDDETPPSQTPGHSRYNPQDSDGLYPTYKRQFSEAPFTTKAIIIILVLILLSLVYSIFSGPKQSPIVNNTAFNAAHGIVENTYPATPGYDMYFPDLTQVKGQSNEAYGFLYCTRPDASSDLSRLFNGLRVSIWRLREKIDGYKRDIIVAVCPFTPREQVEALRKMDLIVVPVQTINPTIRHFNYPRWVDTYTKLTFWKLIHWDRILFMDIDIYFIDWFVDIWDLKETQVIEKIPDGIDPESSYLGYPIKKLYPYLMAASHDTWQIKNSMEHGLMNSGIVMFKPSLVHYNLVMDVAFNDPVFLNEMEQSELSYIYNPVTGSPIPWQAFDTNYNFAVTEPGNDMNDKVKAYHAKVWWENPAKKWDKLSDQWFIYFHEMEGKFKEVSIDTNGMVVSALNHTVSVRGLKLSSGTGGWHAIASKNLTHLPTAEQIKRGVDANEVECPRTYSHRPDGFTIPVFQRDPKFNYMIYFFAEIDNGLPRFTDVRYGQLKAGGENDKWEFINPP